MTRPHRKGGSRVYHGERSMAALTDINKVTLRGMITGILSNPSTTLVTVSVTDYKGKRDPITGRPHRDSVVVSFFGQSGMQVASTFTRGDHVTVTGVIQNTYNHAQLDGRQECWGITIDETPTLTEEASGSRKGRLFPDDHNEVIIRGKVQSVRAAGPWARLSVKTAVDGYRSVNFISYWVGGGEAYAKSLSAGSTVTIVGRVTVQERADKRRKGKKIRFEDVVAREVVVDNVAHGERQAKVYRNTTPDLPDAAEELGSTEVPVSPSGE